MRKIFTLTLGLLAGLSIQAQTFEVVTKNDSKGGASTEFELVGYSIIKNTGTTTNFTWKRILSNMPSGWSNAICDNQTCWAPEVDRNTIQIAPGDSSNLDIHVYLDNISGNGLVEVLVWAENDSLNGDTVRFNAFTWATSVQGVKDPTISIFPNPTQDYLNLKYDNKTQVQVKIYNLLGKQVAAFNHDQNSSINISHLPAGVYVLSIPGEHNAKYSRTFRKVE